MLETFLFWVTENKKKQKTANRSLKRKSDHRCQALSGPPGVVLLSLFSCCDVNQYTRHVDIHISPRWTGSDRDRGGLIGITTERNVKGKDREG